MTGQEWEDSWEFGAGILAGKPCCQGEEYTQWSLLAKAWKCRFIVSRKMTKGWSWANQHGRPIQLLLYDVYPCIAGTCLYLLLS